MSKYNFTQILLVKTVKQTKISDQTEGGGEIPRIFS